jgi:hypothetical protein
MNPTFFKNCFVFLLLALGLCASNPSMAQNAPTESPPPAAPTAPAPNLPPEPPLKPQPAPPPAGQERQDFTMGSTHEGIVMERDPGTGDNIIQVGPPPKPKKSDNEQGSTYIIRPEIYPPGGQHGRQPRQSGDRRGY